MSDGYEQTDVEVVGRRAGGVTVRPSPRVQRAVRSFEQELLRCYRQGASSTEIHVALVAILARWIGCAPRADRPMLTEGYIEALRRAIDENGMANDMLNGKVQGHG